ncbi:hypothetical protein ACFW9D_03190 [Streptomyces sp. NPDC059524]|uniref:hypothetical protein n=1 Tax=Streptomyces sp. NPDC059524 TaxID=3346856 RepID=UPI00367DAFD6
MTRERVGSLCDQLSRWPSLRTTVRDGGGEAELRDLLGQLASDADPDEGLVRTLLDAVERACARQGLAGLTSRSGIGPVDMTSLPPGLADVRGVVGWTCPLGRCDRVVTPDETAQAPTCAGGAAVARGGRGRAPPHARAPV